jgi:hypothetical protein
LVIEPLAARWPRTPPKKADMSMLPESSWFTSFIAWRFASGASGASSAARLLPSMVFATTLNCRTEQGPQLAAQIKKSTRSMTVNLNQMAGSPPGSI